MRNFQEMPDYSNTNIFKLWSPKTNLVFIGSTTLPIDLRLKQLNRVANKDDGEKSLTTQICKLGDASIEILENASFENKKAVNERVEFYRSQATETVLKRAVKEGSNNSQYSKTYYKNHSTELKLEAKENYQKKKKGVVISAAAGGPIIETESVIESGYEPRIESDCESGSGSESSSESEAQKE